MHQPKQYTPYTNFPVFSYPLAAQILLSVEPVPSDSPSTVHLVVSAEGRSSTLPDHMISHTCCSCIRTLLPVSPLATKGGSLLTSAATTGGSFKVGCDGNRLLLSDSSSDSGLSLVKLVILGNWVFDDSASSDWKGKNSSHKTSHKIFSFKWYYIERLL